MGLPEIFEKRFAFLYHPVHLVAFALDPRYVTAALARAATAAPGDGGGAATEAAAAANLAPSGVIRHWLRALGGDLAASLIPEYGAFRAAAFSSDASDLFTSPAMEEPSANTRGQE